MATGQIGQMMDLLREIDFSRINFDTKGEKLARWSGLKYINDVVKGIIENHSNRYFFEYSLLSSTINPNTSELYSFSAIQIDANEPGAKEFADNVSKKVSGIINGLYPTIDESKTSVEDKIEWLSKNWFHNPEMFLFPTIDEVVPFHVKDSKPRDAIGDGLGLFGQLDSGRYIANMSYKRSLSEILQAAKQIVFREKENVNINKKLIDDYHEGARALKYAYDNNFPVSGEEYGYVTFPIISANDRYLTDYYSSMLCDPSVDNPSYKNYFRKGHACGIGHFFLYYKKGNDYLSDDIINNLFLRINQALGLIAINYVYATGLALSAKARKEAIKSAKAAIMSRNISHNLGSHVMAYMKQSLSSVQDMLKNGVLKYAPLDGVNMEGTEIPYLVGISKFLSYLQERQDYIATVSTDYIPYPSVVNFKDAIYDELNPDYRFQRHTEWTGHKPANILLENIAKSEGLSRKSFNETQRQDGNNILIKYGKFDGLNHETEKSDYEKLRQWNFSLPGGIMGRQAVFSIVENVIRNAAKHGTRENGEDLSITFDIFDPMVEENSVLDKTYSEAEDIRDLYVVKLTTSTVVSDKDLEKIHNAINDSLIEENGQLKQSNKGIKEMLISAAWLRNIKIEDLEHGQIDKKAPILRANKNLEEKLYYVFCLPKVKAVALITDRISEGSLGKSVVSLMKKNGWYIFTVADYLKCQNKDFCFVIIDSKRIVDNEVVDNNVASLEAIEDDIKKNSHNKYFVASNYTNIERHRIETDVFDIISGFNNEECFEEAELNLYKQLADEPDFKIAIADTDFRKNLLDQNALGDISELVSVLDDGDDVENYRYVYRKHNDTAKHFKDFIKKQCGEYDFFHKLEFVEGITGGNSTDRIVRHSGLDNLWAYKQVHAMKTKVAIFDERIFTKITGYEMADLGAEPVKTWCFEGLSVKEAKNYIYSYDEKHQKKIKDDVVYEEWDNLQSLESIVAFADKYYPLQSSMKKNSDNINSMVYHKKGIDVFTLTWEKEGRFNIWGFVPEASMEDAGYGKIENVGVITVDDQNKPTIELYADSNNYHYLSIHQGLLDKVYEKISSRREANELKALKLAVTKGLHGKFVKCTHSEEDDYLQGLIIHSGRSKPNEENMPQHQPFVQYSAIENAVFDCKYTLVELLDFACFESTPG